MLVVAMLAGVVPVLTAGGGRAAAKDDRHDPVLDLIAQTPGTASRPAVVTLGIDLTGDGTSLRARLYEPVTTRAGLWNSATGPPPTPESASWAIDYRDGTLTDAGRVVLSVSVPLSKGSSNDRSAGVPDLGPRPLHIELTSSDGTSIDTLRTFLLPEPDAARTSNDNQLAVAVVVDLRLPPAHDADGGVVFESAVLGRVLDFARVLTDRPELPLTVELSPETLDALALIGDDNSLSILRSAVEGQQLLISPWTSLAVDDWIDAGRPDVVTDGLERGREALSWAGLDASTVMRFEQIPSPNAASLVADADTGVTGFVGGREFRTPLVAPVPVATMDDAAGGDHPIAQADPLLAAALRNDDAELAAQWTLAELSRMAHAAGGPDAVVVVASAFLTGWDAYNLDEGGSPRPFMLQGTEPAALARLLDELADHGSLKPVTVDAVLAEVMPVGTAAHAGPSRAEVPGDFGLYLARRTEVEARLHAYEQLIGAGSRSAATAPLHTLMAASANSSLTTGERTEFLDAVDRQVVSGTAGVDFVGRGRITITERSTELPVTVLNRQPAPVSVALHLSSETVDFPEGNRPIVRLEPGRNDLSVPIVARSGGDVAIDVAVTTPDEPGGIILSTGSLRVRYISVSGLGLLLLVAGGAAVAVWWLRVARRGSSVSVGAGATVAPSDPTERGPGRVRVRQEPVTPESKDRGTEHDRWNRH